MSASVPVEGAPAASGPSSGARAPRIVFPGDRRFVQGFLSSGLANLSVQLQNLLILVILLRILGERAYGTWNVVIISLTLASIVASANLQTAVVRYVAGEPDPGAAAGRVRMLFRMTLWFGTWGALLLLAISGPLEWLSDDPLLATVLRIATPFVLFQTLIVLGQAALTAAHRVSRLAALTVLMSVIEVGAVFSGVVVGGSVQGAIIGYVMAKGLHAGVIAWTAMAAFPRPAPPALSVRTALGYALPALPPVVAAWALNSADRYFLGYFHGLDDVGRYSAVTAIANLLLLIPVPLTLTLFPRLVQLWSHGDRAKVERYTHHALAFLVIAISPLVMGLLLVGDHIMAPLTTPAVAVRTRVVLPMALLAASIWVLSTPYLALMKVADRTRTIAFAWGLASIAMVAGSFLLVPLWGAVGAAASRAIGMLVVATIFVITAKRVAHVKFPIAVAVRALAAAGAMGLAISWLLPVSGWPRLAAIIAVGGLVYGGALLFLDWLAGPDAWSVSRFAHPDFWMPSNKEPTEASRAK